jgi:SnoaL-like polyketide cyclase
VASDYFGHDPATPEPLRGPEGVKEFIAAFPDMQITVKQQLAEGDLVA